VTWASSCPNGCGWLSKVSGALLNIWMESRANDVMLVLRCEDIREMDLWRERRSCDFLVCDEARWGIIGASSFDEVLRRPLPFSK
jgi:hypothetical protein